MKVFVFVKSVIGVDACYDKRRTFGQRGCTRRGVSLSEVAEGDGSNERAFMIYILVYVYPLADGGTYFISY